VCPFQADEDAGRQLETADAIGNVKDMHGDREDEVVLAHLQDYMTKEVRKRDQLLRKEQLSQGVLHQMLLSLGRLTLEEVCGV
jgi:hypothetical protein